MVEFLGRIKLVITFEAPSFTEQQIIDFTNNNILPEIETELHTRLDPVVIAGNMTIGTKAHVTKTGNTYEVYPKISLKADTTLTKTQVKNGLDNFLTDLKTYFKNQLISSGIDILTASYHIHKSGGVEI
jgi:hypothetical protein